MYSTKPHLIIGFHDCDESVRDNLLSVRREMKSSSNQYDWLGPGMYFWEGNTDRAWDWAKQAHKAGRIQKPAVIGCLIDLGFCLDFVDSRYLSLLSPAFDRLKELTEAAGFEMPVNKGVNKTGEILIRHLDCAVIKMIHQDREDNDQQPFDSVRGVFWEGDPPYPTAGFRAKNHIQVAVRNPNCLNGFFLPRKLNNNWPKP